MALEKAFDETFGPISEPAVETSSEPKPALEPESVLEKPGTEEETPAEESTAPEQATKEPTETVTETKEPLHPDDEADPEVDRFKLHPSSSPETLATFRELRGALKTQRKEALALRERIQKQETGARPVSDPEVQKEIEELRTFRQRHQIFDDTTYQTRYENPVHEKFAEIINDIKAISNDPNAAQEWENQMRSVGPDRVGKAYWNEGVISQIADPLDRDRLVRKVSTLMELQEKRNQFRQQVAEQPDAYQKFQHQQAADYWQNFGNEAQDEMSKVTPTLGEWAAPKDLKTAKNATEKAAFEAHNATYAQYEELFKKYIEDAATQGPRGMARVSAMAVQGEKRRRDLEAANKKIAKLQAERDKAQEELNKIAGARSRVSQPSTAGSNGQPAPPQKRKAGQSVDDAFKNFFGQ
jgi:hypothetical protein